MRHFVPELWITAASAAAAALAAGRAALNPRLGRYALPLLGLAFITLAAACATAVIAWLLNGGRLR